MSDPFLPGFRFCVQQASRTSKPRKYTVVFQIDKDGQPRHVGGVKPTFETRERVLALIAKKQP